MQKGKLYIVATPIGNLGDITYRAVKVLKHVSFVLAEDTRESGKLLKKYDINTTLISYRDQNHEKLVDKIKKKLNFGLNLALICDSGTPLISDPGFKLVRELRKSDYVIESIPGASALIGALSISGLPTDRFIFLGFLPKSEKKRRDILKRYLELGDTVILYESPKRVMSLLKIIQVSFKNISLVLAKDITKMREEILLGSSDELINILEERNFGKHPHGEFVILMYPFRRKV
jgi:16S rRNA (cytidine1402-2'-O)-methyltransferase